MNGGDILGRIKQWDVNATLAKVAGENPDKWFCSLLEQAMSFLRETKLFPGLRSAADGKFLLHGDRFMATSYEKETQQMNFASFSLPDNFHLHELSVCTYDSEAALDRGAKSHTVYPKAEIPNHRQRPDAFALMRFKTDANDDRIMTVVYEGENHDKNKKNVGGGGWLWSKMFQAMGRCHDTDNSVSGVMISAVMHKHDPRNFTKDIKSQHFVNIARDYLKAHVLLIARLLEYNTKSVKAQSWIGAKLHRLRAPTHTDAHYDFVCTINAEVIGRLTGAMSTSTGHTLLQSAILSPGQEYARYTKLAETLYPSVVGHDVQLGDRLDNWETPVYRMQFRTGGASDAARGMNVVIHAVLRAPVNALVDRAGIRGVLYPKHIEALCAHLKRHCVPKPSHIRRTKRQEIFEVPAEDLDDFLTWTPQPPPAGAAAPAPAAPVHWMFGLQLRCVRSIWKFWDLEYDDLQDNAEEVKEFNETDPPPPNFMKSFLQKLQDQTTLKNGRALSCEVTGYFMFVLPIMYMSMSVFRQISDDLDYVTGTCVTRKQWTFFVDSFVEEIISRDNQANTVSSTQGLLFTKKSKSLFKTIVMATHDEFADYPLDATLQDFLEKECGWRDIDRPESPAIIFKMLRTTHLLSAQTLAKEVLSSPPPRYTQLLETFPLGLQTEVKYVMGHLASFFFFKTKDWAGTEKALEDEDGPNPGDDGDDDERDNEDDEDEEDEKPKKKEDEKPKKKGAKKKK